MFGATQSDQVPCVGTSHALARIPSEEALQAMVSSMHVANLCEPRACGFKLSTCGGKSGEPGIMEIPSCHEKNGGNTNCVQHHSTMAICGLPSVLKEHGGKLCRLGRPDGSRGDLDQADLSITCSSCSCEDVQVHACTSLLDVSQTPSNSVKVVVSPRQAHNVSKVLPKHTEVGDIHTTDGYVTNVYGAKLEVVKEQIRALSPFGRYASWHSMYLTWRRK
jgi:hypothetical protein